MTGASTRKRFQFHLSSAVLIMFTCGALFWINSTGIVTDVGADQYGKFGMISYGVPVQLAEQRARLNQDRWEPIAPLHIRDNWYTAAVVDFVFNGAIIFNVLWVIGMLRLRRRALAS